MPQSHIELRTNFQGSEARTTHVLSLGENSDLIDNSFHDDVQHPTLYSRVLSQLGLDCAPNADVNMGHASSLTFYGYEAHVNTSTDSSTALHL